MIHKPVFRASYHVEVVAPEGVFLLSEHGHSVLKGELNCRLATRVLVPDALLVRCARGAL